MSNVRDFGAVGDGSADDTQALQHAVTQGDGLVTLPRGDYRITRPIEVRLSETGRFGLDGAAGGAKIIMAGAGPALRITGTHKGTGDPTSHKPATWTSERLPTLRNIEIEGAHPDADGVQCVETMQSVFEGVLIRKVRHGVHLHQRNRNVVISHCHVYHNTGVGVYMDTCNLHQINIAGCHISYNRLGGIRIERSQIRNLQITGNDIEYNNYRVHQAEPTPTGEIYIDCTGDDPSHRTWPATVNEVTIVSNTIQATGSPNGANIRVVGPEDNAVQRPGMLTISGNLIGNQDTNIHLVRCIGVVISGNFIYLANRRNIEVTDSRQVTIGANAFGHNIGGPQQEMATGIRLAGSSDCVLSGLTIRDSHNSDHNWSQKIREKDRSGLIEIDNCTRVNVSGCQVLDGAPYGLDINRSSQVNIHGATVMDTRDKPLAAAPIRWRGPGRGNLITACTLGPDADALNIDAESGVNLSGNVQA